MSPIISQEDSERTGLFKSMLGFFSRTFSWMDKKDKDEDEKKKTNSLILDTAKDVLIETKNTGVELISGVSQTVQSNLDVQTILQSQLGPLGPILSGVSDKLTSFGKKIFGKFGEFFKRWLWDSERAKRFRKFFVENIWERGLKKIFKVVGGTLLLLSVLLGSFFTSFVPTLAVEIGKVLSRFIPKRLIDFFKKPKFPIFLKSFIKDMGKSIGKMKSNAITAVGRFGMSIVKFLGLVGGRVGGLIGTVIKPITDIGKGISSAFGTVGKWFMREIGIEVPKKNKLLFKKFELPIKKIPGLREILFKKFDPKGIKGFFSNFGSNLSRVFGALKEIIMKFPGAKLVAKIGRIAGKIVGKILFPFMMIWEAVKGILSGETIRDKILNASAGILGVVFELPEMIGNALLWVSRKIFGKEFLKGFKFDFGAEKIIEVVNVVSDWIFNNVTVPVGDFFTIKIPEAFSSFIDFITSGDKILDAISSVGSWIKENVLLPIETFFSVTIKNSLTELGKKLIEFLEKYSPVNLIKKAFSGIKGLFGLREKETTPEIITSVTTPVTLPEGQKGGLITKTGLIKVHEGEILSPMEKITPMVKIAAREGSQTPSKEIVQTIVESNKSLESKIEKIVGPSEVRNVPASQTLIDLNNVPMIVEDTGLILVSSGVL